MSTCEKAATFLPNTLLTWTEEGKLIHHFPAVVAFADVSGFTAMSEKLASIGREGAETLTSILNAYFTAMINRIERNGGFVGKFGGDAMTIFFPAEDEANLAEVAKCAVATCLELQTAMEDFYDVKTRSGTFSLGMKVGIAAGNVLFQVVGPKEKGREYLLAGLPLDQAAEAEHHGFSGEVIVTPNVVELCGVCGKVLDDGFVKLSADSERPQFKITKKTIPYKETWADLAKAFIDPPIYNRMLLGLDSVGEIRRVSVIFMSFTGLDYDEDPDVTNKLDAVYNWVYGLTQQHNGSINKVDMGDKGSKIILTFGTPTAHENDAQHAVHCGLKLIRGRGEFNEWGLKWKLGIATGVVFAGEVGAPSRQEYTVMGSTVNLSARLMAKCDPGQLLVDDATYNRTLKYFDFTKPRKFKFKGISQPLPTYEPISVKAVVQRREADQAKPLIGRNAEMNDIAAVIEDVIQQRMRVLVIMGPAGAGKSRLSQETLRLVDDKEFSSGGGEALSYAQKSPYLVWISVLRGLMELISSVKAEENLAQLREIVEQADPEHSFRTPLIANLLGISCPDNEITKHFDAKLRQENMYDFLVQYFKFRTKDKPVAMFFEDSQWIDSNSLELIAYLMRNLADCPLMFVLVRRPYSEKSTLTQITEIEQSETAVNISVNEFDRKLTQEFALSCLDAHTIDKELLNFIFDASHGNASFVEELINNLKSQGKIKLVPDRTGEKIKAEKVGKLADVEVPDSLNSLIMSQLDRLGTEAKLTVKVAAVIGRRFSEAVLKGAYPISIDPESIVNSLDELSVQDMISSIEDEEFFNYIFKKVLTRDVAYDSLLFAHRRDYHGKVGLCLEKMFADSTHKWCDELGRHFYQSEDNKRAVKYLRMAGEKSYYDLYANESAEAFYTMALECADAERDPEARFFLLKLRSKAEAILGRLDLLKKDLDEALELAEKQNEKKWKVLTLDDLARYYMQVNDLKAMDQVVNEALEILETIDYPLVWINLSEKKGSCSYYMNNFEEALKWWQKSLETAENADDAKGLMTALTNCGTAYKALGSPDKALEYYEKSVDISRRENNKKSEAVNLGNIGVLHHQRGDFDKALDVYNQAFEIARSIGWKEVQARNLGGLALIYQARGERQKALDMYQEKLTIEQTMGYRKGELKTLGNIGTWYAQYGDYETAISHYRQALEIAHELGWKSEEPQWMLNIGLSLHRRGDLDAAKEILADAIRKSVELGYKVAEDYARRYLGFVLIDMDELDRAESEFKTAQEIAKKLGSKVGLASSKVGLGCISMLRNGNRKLLEEGIDDARNVQDAEHFIKGKIALAKYLMDKKAEKKEQLEILQSALEIAKKAGLRRDLIVIEPMIARLEGNS